jgi:glycine C-acetyltransferase
MDGYLVKLDAICDLAERYNAMVMVDDSHATGYIGPTGRGTPEHCGVQGRVDIITSTLGKALGGASGGYTTGRQEIIDLLRQRSRPYLFSNTLTPSLAAAGIAVFEMLSETTALRDKLMDNTRYFREKLSKVGYDVLEGETAIVPVMLYDAKLANDVANAMLEEGIYVIGFSFPVVPRGEARIRVQISAAHEREHLDRAVAAFQKVGKRLGCLDR